jgi:hypothetical protein
MRRRQRWISVDMSTPHSCTVSHEVTRGRTGDPRCKVCGGGGTHRTEGYRPSLRPPVAFSVRVRVCVCLRTFLLTLLGDTHVWISFVACTACSLRYAWGVCRGGGHECLCEEESAARGPFGLWGGLWRRPSRRCIVAHAVPLDNVKVAFSWRCRWCARVLDTHTCSGHGGNGVFHSACAGRRAYIPCSMEHTHTHTYTYHRCPRNARTIKVYGILLSVSGCPEHAR